MAKKTGQRILIRLISTGKKEDGSSTGYFMTTEKHKQTPKLELKKFDPRAYNSKTGKPGMYVTFKEGKIK